MPRLAASIVLGLSLCTITSAGTEPRNYEFDMAHSRIFFDVDHRGYSVMHGRFAEFGGSFVFDADEPTRSSLNVTIDPASVGMFHEGLNDHLRNPDFFDVEQYPEMTFVSEHIETVDESRFRVHGQFTMLGRTHPLSFDVVLNQTGQARGGAVRNRSGSGSP